MSLKKPDPAKPAAGGPNTEPGRSKSSMNSTRHGILANKWILLQSENNEELEKLRRAYDNTLKPIGELEQELVDEMIWAKWRQRRAITSETAAIDLQMDLDQHEVEAMVKNIDDATRTALAIKALCTESNELDLYSRYETRLHRMYHRALKQLLELQDRRKADGQVAESTQPAPPLEPENEKLPNELPPPAQHGEQPAASAKDRPARFVVGFNARTSVLHLPPRALSAPHPDTTPPKTADAA